MITDIFSVLLFAILIVFIFFALFAFFAGLARFNNMVSELLSVMIIIFLLFDAKFFFLKALIMILAIAFFSVVGYKIIVRAKKIRCEDSEEKKEIGIYSEISYLKRGGRL